MWGQAISTGIPPNQKGKQSSRANHINLIYIEGLSELEHIWAAETVAL